MRWILGGIGGLLLTGLILFGVMLLEAHWEIRSLVPVLPEPAELARLTQEPDGPVRVGHVITGVQQSAAGPALAHSAFLLEWSDGRLFVIDAGMDREQTLAFSRPFELLMGSEPAETFGSLGEQLGGAASRIRGVGFSHLHLDHTGGLYSICAQAKAPVPVFQTLWQADRGNYTTAPGRADLERATCARPQRLEAERGALMRVPGFPGLAALQAGGHTPGSTVFLAHVDGTVWIFSGDVTNFREPMLENRPKERLYSLLITPEATEQLARLRPWLAGLDAQPGFRVVVSHDRDALLSLGPEPWSG